MRRVGRESSSVISNVESQLLQSRTVQLFIWFFWQQPLWVPPPATYIFLKMYVLYMRYSHKSWASKLEQTSDNNTCHFNNNNKKQTIIVMHWSNWIVRHTQVRMSKLFYIRPQHLDRYRSSFAVGKLSRLLVVSSFEFTLKSQCFDLSGSCSKGLKIDYENITCIKTRIKIESWINWKLNIVKHFED